LRVVHGRWHPRLRDRLDEQRVGKVALEARAAAPLAARHDSRRARAEQLECLGAATLSRHRVGQQYRRTRRFVLRVRVGIQVRWQRERSREAASASA